MDYGDFLQVIKTNEIILEIAEACENLAHDVYELGYATAQIMMKHKLIDEAVYDIVTGR